MHFTILNLNNNGCMVAINILSIEQKLGYTSTHVLFGQDLSTSYVSLQWDNYQMMAQDMYYSILIYRQTAGNGCVSVWPNKALIVVVLATSNKIIL